MQKKKKQKQSDAKKATRFGSKILEPNKKKPTKKAK